MWEKDFTKDNFVNNLKEMVKKINKLPCILTSDVNIDLKNPRNADEKFWSNQIEKCLGHFEMQNK